MTVEFWVWPDNACANLFTTIPHTHGQTCGLQKKTIMK